MPKVSQAHLDARRAQILEAALTCFARNGFHRTTMQEIVKQSRLSPGAIYNYFASKEQIIEANSSARHSGSRQFSTSWSASALPFSASSRARRTVGEGASASSCGRRPSAIP